MHIDHNIQPTLFFIPDISGYTKFINEVAIDHSTHIITELLEIIIASNTLDLKVAEIEGDAIFFYHIGKKPTIKELLAQAEQMFFKFHQHLKTYEHSRICQCGACASAHELTLKIVCHFGETTLRKVGKHTKLFGPDVTLAHRLLKNNVLTSEYLLYTSSLEFSEDEKLPGWVSLKRSANNYKEIGTVTYNYIPLEPLKGTIPEFVSRTKFLKFRRPVTGSMVMKVPLRKLHGVVTDFSLRPRWILGLRYIKAHDYLNTIGSKHLCVMPTTTMEFQVTAQNINKGLVEYVEQSNSISWLSPLNVIFILKRIATDTTKMSIEIHYKKNLISKLYLDFPLRMMMFMIAQISLMKLKYYVRKSPA
ncbi:DUF2652 domain-containing protein [Arenibacter sp. GZD96]|uniref:DUF2652 domain-containing protein n=1 Tax=Aurantibrevibacter litoralis TaxID=3106030 RepID=UPI002AFFF3B9|nr:DUF2652 domain-containing protein [Arenibacter sp. GZD-96]MEA1786737.1 DUF2652 domain-containing protein [Arenibacter sp. GZD-96]